MNAPELFYDSRPWGEELWLTKDQTVRPSMVKIIIVNPREALSLQFHHNREEFWVVISGDGEAEVDGQLHPLKKGSTVFVPKGVKHRIRGGTETLIFVELAYGEFDEKDIVRLEDKYGRT